MMALKIVSIVVIPIASLIIFNCVSFSGISEGSQQGMKEPVKLVFIYHSVGGHWLAHDLGGLTNELNKHGIYVNDITYGWEPDYLTEGWFNKAKRKAMRLVRLDQKGPYNIGDRTDIGHWYEWFVGKHAEKIMTAVYAENRETYTFGDHSNSSSKYSIENPGEKVPNEIIMFKSCYPNSLLSGNAEDPPNRTPDPPRNFMP